MSTRHARSLTLRKVGPGLDPAVRRSEGRCGGRAPTILCTTVAFAPDPIRLRFPSEWVTRRVRGPRRRCRHTSGPPLPEALHRDRRRGGRMGGRAGRRPRAAEARDRPRSVDRPARPRGRARKVTVRDKGCRSRRAVQGREPVASTRRPLERLGSRYCRGTRVGRVEGPAAVEPDHGKGGGGGACGDDTDDDDDDRRHRGRAPTLSPLDLNKLNHLLHVELKMVKEPHVVHSFLRAPRPASPRSRPQSAGPRSLCRPVHPVPNQWGPRPTGVEPSGPRSRNLPAQAEGV